MILYHGTDSIAAKAIKREGLKPHRETAFRMHGASGVNVRTQFGEDKQWLYVETLKEWAIKFAKFRAHYNAAKPGMEIPDEEWAFIKDNDAPVIKRSRPTVITFDVPEAIAKRLDRDPQAGILPGMYVCPCIIPPQHIVRVETV